MSQTEVDQLWTPIDEFPQYEVSSWGLIFSHRRKSVIRPTRNNHGHLRISLVNTYGRFTRSVALLVATAFVPAEDSLSDTVVIRDGVKTNCAADNLMWRPRGFAWEYTHQLSAPRLLHYTNLPVVNTRTGVVYPSVEMAGIQEGLLFKDIWRSTYTGQRCYPSHAAFEVLEGV